MVRFAGEIQKNSSRLLTLINDILQLSELDTRNFNDDFAWVNFADTVRNCVDLLALTAKKKKCYASSGDSAGSCNDSWRGKNAGGTGI